MTTFELISVTDVRPIDWESGKRVPVDACDLPECTRCGRRHAVVWRLIERPSGATLTVGSGCGPKLVADGLLPGVELPAVKAAERAARAEDKRVRRSGADARARELAEVARAAIVGMVPPKPVWGPDEYGRAEFVTIYVGDVRQMAVARQLDRETLERQVAARWLDQRMAEAIRAAGCPDRAVSRILCLARNETDFNLRYASLALMD
jgi:hypothetical protein